MRVLKNIVFFFFLVSLFSCDDKKQTVPKDVRIAFVSDIHFQDIYAKFPDANYKGVENKATGKFVNIRTMNAQLKSTRIFNENTYFKNMKIKEKK